MRYARRLFATIGSCAPFTGVQRSAVVVLGTLALAGCSGTFGEAFKETVKATAPVVEVVVMTAACKTATEYELSLAPDAPYGKRLIAANARATACTPITVRAQP